MNIGLRWTAKGISLFLFGLIIAWTASAQSTTGATSAVKLSQIDEARISWFAGTDVVACGRASSASAQDCWTVNDAASVADAKNVLQGNFVGNMAASWIEERTSGYSLCVLTANKTEVCEPIAVPYVYQTKLTIAHAKSGHQKIRMAFIGKGTNAAQRAAVGKTFFAGYVAAKSNLVSKLNFTARRFNPAIFVAAGSTNSTTGTAFKNAKVVGATTNLIDEDGGCDDGCDDGGGDGGGDGGSGGGGGGDGGGGSDPGDGGTYDPPSGNVACVTSCNNYYYGVLVPRCNGMGSAAARAVCFGSAAAAYGQCLSFC